jgi:hypothetical protein
VTGRKEGLGEDDHISSDSGGEASESIVRRQRSRPVLAKDRQATGADEPVGC